MAKTYDATNVPAIVTITNTKVLAQEAGEQVVENEAKAYVQLFKTNFKIELDSKDVIKLVVNDSAALLYYMLMDGVDGLKVETAAKQ